MSGKKLPFLKGAQIFAPTLECLSVDKRKVRSLDSDAVNQTCAELDLWPRDSNFQLVMQSGSAARKCFTGNYEREEQEEDEEQDEEQDKEEHILRNSRVSAVFSLNAVLQNGLLLPVAPIKHATQRMCSEILLLCIFISQKHTRCCIIFYNSGSDLDGVQTSANHRFISVHIIFSIATAHWWRIKSEKNVIPRSVIWWSVIRWSVIRWSII